VRPLSADLTPAFQENWFLSYFTYFALEAYLVHAAAAIYRRRWHAPALSTKTNVAALAAGSWWALAVVTFHPITYSAEIHTPFKIDGADGEFTRITHGPRIYVSGYMYVPSAAPLTEATTPSQA
jgi:hypothetical protein